MKKYDESPLGFLSEDKLDAYLSHMEHDFSNQDMDRLIEQTFQKTHPNKSWLEKIRRRPERVFLAVSFILVVLIPGSVYAANRLWETYFEKNVYSSKLTIQENKDPMKAQNVAEPKEDETYYRLKMIYLPENMEPIPQNEGEVPMKFWNPAAPESGESISTMLVKLEDKQEFESRYSKETEKLTLNGHSVWLISKEGQYSSDLNKEAYILFEEEGYVLFIMFGQEINGEEVNKIISGAELIESTVDYASYYTTDMDMAEAEVVEIPQKPSKISADSSNLKSLNEKMNFKNPTDIHTGNQPQQVEMGLTVNEVTVFDQLTDALTDLNDASVENRLEQMKQAGVVDDKGRFVSYEVKNYQRGNGVDSIDEVINTEKQKMKFVMLSITLENQSELDLDDYYFQSQLHTLKRNKDDYIYKYEDEQYGTPLHFSGSNHYELNYISQPGDDLKSYYNIGDFSKHSKRELTIGYLVPEKDLKNLFLEENTYVNTNLEERNFVQLFEK